MLIAMVRRFVVFAAREMYQLRRNSSRLDELQRIFVGVVIGALVTLGIVAFVLRDFPYSRSLVSLSWLLAMRPARPMRDHRARHGASRICGACGPGLR